jgi:hypothetical protein
MLCSSVNKNLAIEQNFRYILQEYQVFLVLGRFPKVKRSKNAEQGKKYATSEWESRGDINWATGRDRIQDEPFTSAAKHGKVCHEKRASQMTAVLQGGQ